MTKIFIEKQLGKPWLRKPKEQENPKKYEQEKKNTSMIFVPIFSREIKMLKTPIRKPSSHIEWKLCSLTHARLERKNNS